MFYRVLSLLCLIALFAACTPEATSPPATLQRATSDAPTAAAQPTGTPTIPADELTPVLVTSDAVILLPDDNIDNSAIELLSGSADTCSNDEAYANLLSFEANYTDLKATNIVAYRMTDTAGNVLSEDEVEGENKNGEEGWGIYPQAYDVPASTSIIVEVTVYVSEEERIATSRSVLIYDCTTGETLETSFTDNP